MNIKLKKLKIILIVLLLNCLKSYAQKINDDIPSTGNLIKSDTTFVSINIDYIRLANAKLLERQYLLEVNQYKDFLKNGIEVVSKYDDLLQAAEEDSIGFQVGITDEDYNLLNDEIVSVRKMIHKYQSGLKNS